MERNLYREQILSFKPYVPGKSIDDAKAEYGLSRMEKLASNENPLGPSPKAVEEMKRELERVNLYPDPEASALKLKLADKLGVEPDAIVVGNGGEQILQLIAQTFINPGDEAVMADATFDMYASSVSFLGGIPVRIPLQKMKHDIVGFAKAVTDRAKLMYICNPNNPTGNIVTKAEIDRLICQIPEDIILVFDEAYYDFAKADPDYPNSLDLLAKRPNTVILRTFSKIAGIAGVRIGYAVTSVGHARQMSKIKPTFNVNRLALAAATGAAEDGGHIRRTVELNDASMRMMEAFFEKHKLEYVRSYANFVFVDLGMDSRMVFEELMKRGVIVRPGFNWGFVDWIRVSTGTLEQTQFFLDKLKELIVRESRN